MSRICFQRAPFGVGAILVIARAAGPTRPKTGEYKIRPYVGRWVRTAC